MTPVQKFVYAEAARISYERLHPGLSADNATEEGYREARSCMRPGDVLEAVERLFFTPIRQSLKENA